MSNNDLERRIAQMIYDAVWYFECDGYQNQHDSDLSLSDHYMEDEDEVVAAIIKAAKQDLLWEFGIYMEKEDIKVLIPLVDNDMVRLLKGTPLRSSATSEMDIQITGLPLK